MNSPNLYAISLFYHKNVQMSTDFQDFLADRPLFFGFLSGSRGIEWYCIKKGGITVERLIKIGTVTEASRARRGLLDEGVHSRLTKAESAAEGCLWGLRVNDEHLHTAVKLLRRLGLSYEIL
jgi:hypothetical protein